MDDSVEINVLLRNLTIFVLRFVAICFLGNRWGTSSWFFVHFFWHLHKTQPQIWTQRSLLSEEKRLFATPFLTLHDAKIHKKNTIFSNWRWSEWGFWMQKIVVLIIPGVVTPRNVSLSPWAKWTAVGWPAVITWNGDLRRPWTVRTRMWQFSSNLARNGFPWGFCSKAEA